MAIQQGISNINEQGAGQFSIEMNGSMFAMLTQNVYTDRILAPIREWSTNAIDACLAANLPINFDVHLPTLEEPEFSVRDYGSGLSEDDLLGLFTVLGASTKRNSNEYNGTFGVGRLSGLAYTDAFTVISYHNGTCYQYLISITDNIPVQLKLQETTTTEPNGMKLSLAVSHNDIPKFITAAELLYYGFSHKPNVNIPLKTTALTLIDTPNYTISSQIVASAGDTHIRLNETTVLMGNVRYKINSNIPDLLTPYTQGVIVTFKIPIGKLSINPGRESLSYDKATIECLSSATANLYRNLAADTVQYCKQNNFTTWQTVVTINTLVAQLPNANFEAITSQYLRETFPELQASYIVLTQYADSYGKHKHTKVNIRLSDFSYESVQLTQSYKVNAWMSTLEPMCRIDRWAYSNEKHPTIPTIFVVDSGRAVNYYSEYISKCKKDGSYPKNMYIIRCTSKTNSDRSSNTDRLLTTLDELGVPYTLASSLHDTIVREAPRTRDDMHICVAKVPVAGSKANPSGTNATATFSASTPLAETELPELPTYYIPLKGFSGVDQKFADSTLRAYGSLCLDEHFNLIGIQTKYISMLEHHPELQPLTYETMQQYIDLVAPNYVAYNSEYACVTYHDGHIFSQTIETMAEVLPKHLPNHPDVCTLLLSLVHWCEAVRERRTVDDSTIKAITDSFDLPLHSYDNLPLTFEAARYRYPLLFTLVSIGTSNRIDGVPLEFLRHIDQTHYPRNYRHLLHHYCTLEDIRHAHCKDQ